MSGETSGYWLSGEWFEDMRDAYLDALNIPAEHVAQSRADMAEQALRENKRQKQADRIERVQDSANELWHGSAWSDLFGKFEADLGWDS